MKKRYLVLLCLAMAAVGFAAGTASPLAEVYRSFAAHDEMVSEFVVEQYAKGYFAGRASVWNQLADSAE